jgi:hypothetical protein
MKRIFFRRVLFPGEKNAARNHFRFAATGFAGEFCRRRCGRAFELRREGGGCAAAFASGAAPNLRGPRTGSRASLLVVSLNYGATAPGVTALSAG